MYKGWVLDVRRVEAERWEVIEDLMRYLRKAAEGHRKTFIKADPPGGHNAVLYDKWADDLDTLESRLKWAEEMLKKAQSFVIASMHHEEHCERASPSAEQRWLADYHAGPKGEGDGS
jgi:hypothetical protein